MRGGLKCRHRRHVRVWIWLSFSQLSWAESRNKEPDEVFFVPALRQPVLHWTSLSYRSRRIVRYMLKQTSNESQKGGKKGPLGVISHSFAEEHRARRVISWLVFGRPRVVQPAFYYPFCNTPLGFNVNNKHLRNKRLQPLNCKCSWTGKKRIAAFT